ncbi:MAG: glycosyltransferase family 4 protein [Oscillochloridaceae bacterium umkhey_bin13]
MHICYISQEYPPETGWGGIGSYTYEMAHGLVRTGHRVSVISLAQRVESIVDDGGVKVHRVLPSPRWDRWKGLWRMNRVWPGFAWAAAQRLRLIHRHYPVTIVEAPEGRADGLFIGLLPERPALIVRLHTAKIFVDRLNRNPVNWRSKLSYFFERTTISMADKLTSPSRAMVDLTKTWISLDRRSVTVIPNPITTDFFCGEADIRRSEAVFAGRIERRKGIDTLCTALPEVLKKLEHVSFRFIGDIGISSNGKSWKENILASSPLVLHRRIHFESLPRTKLVQAYSRAVVIVIPSHWENFPYTALEAMASGTPVIATNVGGFPEIVESGVTGLLVPVDDPRSLGEAMYALLVDPDRAAHMGRAARTRIVDQFSTERIVPQMIETYGSVQAGRRQ